MKLAIRFVTAALILALVLATPITIMASAQSLPDEPLYQVKVAWEGVRYATTLNAEARQNLETEYQQERQEEVDAMHNHGRTGTIEVVGILEAMDSNSWTIGGMNIKLSADSAVEGTPVIGARVRASVHIERNGALTLIFARIMTNHPGPSPIEPPTRPPHSTPMPRPTIYPTATIVPTGTVVPPTRPPHPTPPPTATIVPIKFIQVRF